jgi:curli biogenesis system outer membrane secretion channel CsgG
MAFHLPGNVFCGGADPSVTRLSQLAMHCGVLALCTALLGGCASWRDALSRWGAPAVDPVLQRQIDAHYARGATALLRSDLDEAVAAWRQYVAVAPRHLAQAQQVRGYLTLLDREAARRFARRAAAGERSAAFAPTDRLHVALFPFTNQGPNAPTRAGAQRPDAAPTDGQSATAATAAPAGAAFNRALMAMIAADLARVPELTLLEREKIDQLLQEMKLATSGLVDRGTITAQARLLGAGTIVVGSVINEPGPDGPGSGRYKINTAVSDVQAARVIGTQEADGRQAEFFVLQKRVVYGILESLDIRDIPASVNQVHTRSWAAYVQFARGLGLLADDRFADARAAFAAALKIDPEFGLAQDALLATPERALSVQDLQAELRNSR